MCTCFSLFGEGMWFCIGRPGRREYWRALGDWELGEIVVTAPNYARWLKGLQKNKPCKSASVGMSNDGKTNGNGVDADLEPAENYVGLRICALDGAEVEVEIPLSATGGELKGKLYEAMFFDVPARSYVCLIQGSAVLDDLDSQLHEYGLKEGSKLTVLLQKPEQLSKGEKFTVQGGRVSLQGTYELAELRNGKPFF